MVQILRCLHFPPTLRGTFCKRPPPPPAIAFPTSTNLQKSHTNYVQNHPKTNRQRPQRECAGRRSLLPDKGHGHRIHSERGRDIPDGTERNVLAVGYGGVEVGYQWGWKQQRNAPGM